MAYVSISVEGGLFPSDLLDRIAAGDSNLPGQKAADFGLNGTRRLTDEIQSAFSDSRSYWDAFQRRLERSRESRTTITREDWITKFMELLGFEKLVVQRLSAEVGKEKYFISHRAGDYPEASPVHVVGIDQELDRRDSTSRRSPHATVQEYLNRSDALWGIATNGRGLRLLRNIARLSKPTYLEFDLEGMIAGNLYSEFVLLYRLLHVSRFPKESISAHECILERYYQQGIDEGSRVREKLRDGVEETLRTLGTAFLSHASNERLCHRFQTGELDANGYYRQLLHLVYRFLFLMAAEERRLLFPTGEDGKRRQALYTKYYSISVLRNRADRHLTEDRHSDLWLGLRETFRMLRDNDAASLFGLSALNGELFNSLSCPDLEGAVCTNRELLSAIRELSTFRDEGGQRRRVNYAGLDVEEFGSVYESLLDFHPQVTLQPSAFDLVAGGERKQTGSYYTPPELVHELIESALVPVMENRLRSLKTREEREAALLGLRVCDPASGSGHFLLAAGRRIARELATVRSGEQESSPEKYRHALRDVIRTCIYAVDKNSLAVDLCKVALWIEGHSAGLPLSFLDHHIKCGDSLVGLANLEVLDDGIPDEAYQPVTGDDKKAASYYKKRNQEEKRRERQLSLGESGPLAKITDSLAEDFETLGTLDEHTPDEVNAKEGLYNSLRRQGTDWWRLKVACDLWTAAFFMPFQQEDAMHLEGVPTTGTLRKHLQTNSAYPTLVGQAVATSQNHPFFHWPLEFPDVFERGGFDVVLGNPPFGNAIENKTARDDREARYFSNVLSSTAKGAYDKANLFFGQTVRLLKRGGSYGMICPRATASGRSSEPLRRLLDQQATPHMLWCPDNPKLFGGATVFVCLAAGVKGLRPQGARVSTSGDLASIAFREIPLASSLRDQTWWGLIQSTDTTIQVNREAMIHLQEAASIWAGCTTSVAYELVSEVSDDPNGTGPKLITTGAIDRFKCRWGTMKIRYLKRDYRYPRWPTGISSRVVASARDKQRRPKILVAGLSKVIEAVLDAEGELAGVVSTHVVVPIADQEWALPRLLAVLNSAVFSFMYFERYGAKQMSGGNCTIGKTELLSTPVPLDLLDERTTGTIPEHWKPHLALDHLDRLNVWRTTEKLAKWLHVTDESAEWFTVNDRLHMVVSALYGLSPKEHAIAFDWWQQRRTHNVSQYPGQST